MKQGWFEDVGITIGPEELGLKVTDTNVIALLLNGQLDMSSQYCPLRRLDYNQVRPHSAHAGMPPARARLLAAGARPGLVDGSAAHPLAPSPFTCNQPQGLPS